MRNLNFALFFIGREIKYKREKMYHVRRVLLVWDNAVIISVFPNNNSCRNTEKKPPQSNE